MKAEDILKIIITSISTVDFIVFTVLFTVYLSVIQFKAQKVSTKIGAFVILLAFLIFKALHLPVFLSTLPGIQFTIPGSDYILLFLTWSNILLAIAPLIATFIVFFRKSESVGDDWKNKHVNIIMPIYNETPDALWKAVQSVQLLDYNKQKIVLYLAFDDDQDSDAFLYICKKLNVNPSSSITEVYDKIKIFLCKFKHGGKKSAQQGAFRLIKSQYPSEFLKTSLLFFIDSDIQLKHDSLWQFVRHMQLYNKTCLTGMITCITSETQDFLSYYQDIEYISGQIFWRNMEDCFGGATSCLPGAFTVLEWPSFDAVSDMYFSKTQYEDAFEYQRFYLGEDRYLTHLLMEREPHKIGFCDSAICKTEAPNSVLGLLKQRRRWFLGHISNDTWMISSIKLWRTYPILTLFNFLNNSRNTSIYIYLLYFVLFLNKNVSFVSWFIYIILPIILNWLFITYYALKLQRKMNILFYFIIVVCQPIFSMMFMYYTIYNIKTQSWGGVRIDRESEKSTVIQITESTSIDSSST